MICYQDKSKSSINGLNHQNMNQSSANHFLHQQNVIIKRKPKQSTGCFCFSFTKKTSVEHDKVYESRIQPDESVKDQALKLSREIATKSFKNIVRLKSNTMRQKDSETKKVKKQTSPNIYLEKIQKILVQKPVESKRVSKQKKKQQFNMSRLTFSAVNKSYQKTVNTTINTSTNQSISIDNSNILGSLVSLKKQKDKTSQDSFNYTRKVSNKVQKKVQKYKPVSSVRQISIKKLNILKTTPQFEPIKQENEQETKVHKVIKRLNAKTSESSSQISKKSIQSPRKLNKLSVRKVDTQEQILSNEISNEDDIDCVRYDYSSIVVDYFNPTPEMIQKMKQNTGQMGQNVLQTQKIRNNILPTQKQQQIEKQKQFTINQLSQSSMFQNNSIFISQSNTRLINNNSSSVSSVESNLLSFSINNNNFSDFSCSFESIAKKQAKYQQKNQNIFDGLGLSLIHQNEQSEINKDSSQVSEYHPQDIEGFEQQSIKYN